MPTPTFDAFDTTLDERLDAGSVHGDADVFPGDVDWYRLLERHVLGPDAVVRVHRAALGEETASLVLIRERFGPGGPGVRLRALQNYYTSDFRPLCTSSAARALLGPLVERVLAIERPAVVSLSPLDPDAPETADLRAAFAGRGWAVRESVASVNWRCPVDGSYARYVAERPSRVRRTLGRRTRRWEALHGAGIEIHDGRGGTDELAARYRHVYDRSWKVPEPHDGFVPALIAYAAERERLRLGIASIDGVPVAVHLWFVTGRRASIYKLAHDKAHDELSPGTVLMGAMLRHVIEIDGVTCIDFLTGDDAYKRDWMTERREKLEMRAFDRRSVIGRAAFVRTARVAPALARLRHAVRRDRW